MPISPTVHEIILYALLSGCLIASTLWLLFEQRRRWYDDWRKPIEREWK